MRVRKNIFWGLGFILAAVALVVKKLGYLQDVGIWSILFSVILAAIFVKGIIKMRWASIMFSAAFFIIINDELLHMEALTPWTVLGVAFLGTLGLGMIFPKGTGRHCRAFHKGHPKHIGNKITRNVDPSTENFTTENLTTEVENKWNESDDQLLCEDGETIQQDVVFGNYVKYVKSQQLSHVCTDCVFGQMSIYLTEASLKNHRACVSADVVFGTTNIYVPADWSVSIDVDNVFGDVAFHGKSHSNAEDKLLINGDVVFGSLQIYYV